MKKIFSLIICLSFLPLAASSYARSKFLGNKGRTQTISGTVTLGTSSLGRYIIVDTSGGVAEITIPIPNSAKQNSWVRFMRDGGSGVSIIVTSGSIDLPGVSGTRLFNHPSNESGSNVLLIYGGKSGNSVFAFPDGTWGLQ